MAEVIRILGEKALRAKFRRLIDGIKNKRPLFKRIGVKLLNEINNNFKTESNDGKAWQDFSPATLLSDPRRQGGKLLQDTGRLKNSFAMNVSNTKLIVGTNTEYAPFHEEGTNKIPKRPFMPDEGKTLSIALDETGKFVKEIIRKERL